MLVSSLVYKVTLETPREFPAVPCRHPRPNAPMGHRQTKVHQLHMNLECKMWSSSPALLLAKCRHCCSTKQTVAEQSRGPINSWPVSGGGWAGGWECAYLGLVGRRSVAQWLPFDGGTIALLSVRTFSAFLPSHFIPPRSCELRHLLVTRREEKAFISGQLQKEGGVRGGGARTDNTEDSTTLFDGGLNPIQLEWRQYNSPSSQQ